MNIIAFTDVHLYAPHAMQVDWHGCLNPPQYYLGDNIDITNCPLSSLSLARAEAKWMASHFKDRCVKGNHELDAMGEGVPVFLRVGSTLLTHGHHLFWSEAHVRRYDARKPGMPAYKIPLDLGAWLARLDGLRHIARPGLTALFCRRVEQLAVTYNVSMIVCGHRHPPIKIEREVAGVRVVVLPRGRNEVEID